jgi:signal transduction histidine kinase
LSHGKVSGRGPLLRVGAKLPSPASLSSTSVPLGEPGTVSKLFGDLKLRPKLMVLHNIFFLILAAAAYFSLIPLFEHQVADARSREFGLIRQVFSSDLPLGRLNGLVRYDYLEGSAETLKLDLNIKEWLDGHPGEVWSSPDSSYIYRREPRTGLYRRVKVAQNFYNDVVQRAQFTLFMVLGAIYMLAVLLLETAIMPMYVYRPLRLMLNADNATQQGDRDHELIPEHYIPGDEIGQIMRSRNAAISELRRQEDNLAAALRRLEEQDRLASLGLLSASVAHELNTPLAVLRGSIEKLRETTLDRPTLERLTRMDRVTQRLRSISETLIDFARQRKQEIEAVHLRPVIDEAWALVAIDERAGNIDFENEVRTEHQITGNPDRLVQVFVNLLRNALNAIHAAEGGARGEIQVRSRQISWNGKGWISVTVEDNGPGIPKDVLPDIFEAFVTTRLDARGTGLGLTVAEGIISQHGGTISAFNRPGGGACLEVRLPVVR